jgi:hypothetical protein
MTGTALKSVTGMMRRDMSYFVLGCLSAVTGAAIGA